MEIEYAQNAEVEKYRIPLLDGTNCNDWKFRIETLLTELELYRGGLYDSIVTIEESNDTQTQIRK